MPKKIYDIKPPKVARKKEGQSGVNPESSKIYPVKEFSVSNSHPDKKRNQRGYNKNEGRSKWVPISISILAIMVVVGVYLFFKLPKVDIIIWPKVDTLTFQQTMTVDKSADVIDSENAVIPAQYFQTTKTSSQNFPATGNASNDGKASGTITVYNKYDPPATLTLRAGTHFISDSGKLFIASKRIVIPAGTKSGSKVTPGSIQVQVEAVEAGDSYNIAPSQFSVPGLKGTSYYYSTYATSVSAMTGGYTGKVKKVTDDDIQGAEDILTEKTTSDALSDLKNQIPSDYILLDNAVYSDVTSASTQTKSGAIVDNFTYQVIVKAGALAFKRSDIEQFAKNYIISQIPEGKTLLENSFKISYSASVVDISNGKATLSLDFSSGVYQDIDKNSITLSLLGENANQINETINNTLGEQISKIEINFWPFWVNSAPNNQKVINLELKF